MNEPIVKIGTNWICRGQDGTPPLKHRVLDVSDNEIVTWSEPIERPLPGQEAIAGYSWFGPLPEFINAFQRTF